MIKYLGSKRLLVDDIYAALRGPGIHSVLDVFSGTARVGHFLKSKGLRVISNDYNYYAFVLAKCYVEVNKESEITKDAQELIDMFNNTIFDTEEIGYFEDTFCIQSRFFHPKNGRKIDCIRELLSACDLEPSLNYVLLVSLMEAADRVDSTCGLQMAYLKKWAPRAHNELKLRLPNILPASEYGECAAVQLEAEEFVKRFTGDAAYLDPPYNQHSYLGNYHVWESLCLWDKPEFYGIACKRTDVKTRKSEFNRKNQAKDAFIRVINSLNVKKIVVSFNDEGFISKQEMEEILSSKGSVLTITKDYKRYVGAQIGIYNLQGEITGEITHLRNKEYLYVVECT